MFFNAVGPITLDKQGNLYASVLACDADKRGVWKVTPDGTSQVLLTAADGLDIPTDVVFGRTGRDRFNLYITNGAYSVLGPSQNTPSVMKLHLGVPGTPPAW